MGRYSQAAGAVGEQIARMQLQALGFEMIRKSARWIVTKWLGPSRAMVAPNPDQKFESDWRAIEPGAGRSVYIEVKTGGKMVYSRLEDHQHDTLREHAEYGGRSLIVWIVDGRAYVMDYADVNLRPRARGLSVEEAAALCLTNEREG